MNDIIDANEATPKRPLDMSFKLIAFGMLAGLIVSAANVLLVQLLEIIFFRMGILGLMNVSMTAILGMFIILMLVWFIFNQIKSGLAKDHISIPFLFKTGIIIYIIVIALQFIFPRFLPYVDTFPEGINEMIEEKGMSYFLYSFIGTVTYLSTLFGTVFIIIGIGRSDKSSSENKG